MSYVQELRALVGHRPLILVAAGVLILNKQEHLLLQRRTDNGLWGIPGGSIEVGESTEEAARREAQEETGLTVGQMTLFGVFSGSDLCYEYPNGDQAAIVSVVYRTSQVEGEIQVDGDEGMELRFFPANELPAVELSPPNKPIIKQFLAVQAGTV